MDNLKVFNIIAALIFAVGVGSVLYHALRDPVAALKDICRFFKSDGSIRFKIFFFPIWGTIYIIDYFFKLNIYIDRYEDVTKPFKVNFSVYEKYIEVNTFRMEYVKRAIRSLPTLLRSEGLTDDLILDNIKVLENNNKVIIKIEGDFSFNSFNLLVERIAHLAPKNRVYNPKGILINRYRLNTSYYCFVDNNNPSKLIGKNYKNRKFYIETYPLNDNHDNIYMNSEVEYVKRFKFKRFMNELQGSRFEDMF